MVDILHRIGARSSSPRAAYARPTNPIPLLDIMSLIGETPEHACGRGTVLYAAPVRVPDEVAAADPLTDPPRRREDVALKMSFPVASIDAARTAAAAAGGVIDDPGTEWDFRGHRVCHGHDPEGNVISIRAPAG